MAYICENVDRGNDNLKGKRRCESVKQRYNQCCQHCSEAWTCKKPCDYLYRASCIRKIEISEENSML